MKSFLGLLVLMLAVSACKKDEDVPSSKYYIQFKLDGELIQIKSLDNSNNTNVLGKHNQVGSSGDYYATSVSGSEEMHVITKNTAVVIIGHESPIQTGITYTTHHSGISGAIQSSGVILSYTNHEGVMYLCNWLHDEMGHPSEGRVRISEITSDAIIGTFSGIYYNPDFTAHHTITEGEFKVKLVD